jgi:protein-S-isoprenylcysteine O-methyltransferase Ste14
MWIRGALGVVLLVVGAVWILQGVGLLQGSAMSGHGQYAALGVGAAIVGAALLLWAARVRHRQASALADHRPLQKRRARS